MARSVKKGPFVDGHLSEKIAAAQAALAGVNAAVVGLLLAAFYRPVWVTGIGGAADFALAITAFLLLFMWQTPPWLVVVASAIAGAIIAAW